MINGIIDMLFGIDILLFFNTAYYDDENDLVENRKAIANNYLYGWFSIDILAIIPFDHILSAGDYGSMARIARIGRLYKLAKLTKLFRVLKIMKERSKLMKQIHEIFKIGVGFERLFFFMIVFFLLCHIGACLWLIMAAMKEDFTDNPDDPAAL